MPSRVMPGPVQEDAVIREAVCINTKKIFDSCKDKDCIEDLRVYPTVQSQTIIDSAVSVRAKSAELLYITLDVREVAFNRGYYAIDANYYYRIRGEALAPVNQARDIEGLSVFCKRVILFGSEGNSKVFTSDTALGGLDSRSIAASSLPAAVAEAVDPIVLNMGLADASECNDAVDFDIPDFISKIFEDELNFDGGAKCVYVSLGQFSIIRLERTAQLLIPAYDYCVPEKECIGGCDDDPCTLFSRIDFPVDEFFPPDTLSAPEGYREAVAQLHQQ
ncbi:MAG: hypothetical protein IJG63_01895 [Oscillospiraceae bacterium]|nr:hypothetical protein [Oscillospiraceae bacterium]